MSCAGAPAARRARGSALRSRRRCRRRSAGRRTRASSRRAASALRRRCGRCTSRRRRAVSIASSWTQANSTWFTRRCRSKLSRLYSNSQRSTRHQQAPLDEEDRSGAGAAAMRLVAHRRVEPPGVGIAEQLGQEQGVSDRVRSVAARSSASTSAKSAGIVEAPARRRAASSSLRSRSRTRPCSSVITASTESRAHRSKSSRRRPGPGRWRWPRRPRGSSASGGSTTL